MLPSLIHQLKLSNWTTYHTPYTVCIGHCTKLTTVTHASLQALSQDILNHELPIHFVGLPTSDLYMMGRPSSPQEKDQPHTRPLGTFPHTRPRGTIQPVSLIQEYNLSACIGVNNMGNAFTPYGTGDPLQLACWGVGLYHAGTVEGARVLYECVSSRARAAIFGKEDGGEPFRDSAGEEGAGRGVGRRKRMLLIRNEDVVELPGSNGEMVNVPARQRLGVQDVVWDPPETRLRSVVWDDEYSDAIRTIG